MGLSPLQVAQVAQRAGFRGTGLVWAVAVSMAEDGNGDPARKSPPNYDGSIDRGLWQINNKAHPNVSDAQAYTASGNAQAAYQISGGGQNWKPWSTFNNGRASGNYSAAQAVVNQLLGGTAPANSQPAAPQAGGAPAGSITAEGVKYPVPQVGADHIAQNLYGKPYAQLTDQQKLSMVQQLTQISARPASDLQGWSITGALGLTGITQDLYEAAIYAGVIVTAVGLILVGAWATAKHTEGA